MNPWVSVTSLALLEDNHDFSSKMALLLRVYSLRLLSKVLGQFQFVQSRAEPVFYKMNIPTLKG
jgi:hypothetical protein